MRCAHELNAALGDGAGCGGLELGPDFVDDDDLRHVVLDGLDHYGMLPCRARYLHPARAPDGRVRDIPIAANLVGGIDDDDALAEIVRQYACNLAQHGRLPHAGPAQEQDALPGLHDVLDDCDGAVDGTAEPKRQADDQTSAIPDGRYTVEGTLDACTVVLAERANAGNDVLN